MADARVEAAVAHWAPRFIANGVPLTDFQEVTGSVRHWEQWCAAWSERAQEHETLGRQALAEGRGISAGRHLETAAVCYHFGKFLFVQDQQQMRAAHRRAVDCRTTALPLLDPPGERVEIAYPPATSTTLKGNLRCPRGVARPPVVVLVPGLDSTKEEMGSYEELLLARRLATLAVDGPGQGEAEYDLPIRGDYEVAVAAVLDYVQSRADLDAQRVGLWGVSLGGYYAPRAAAFNLRVRACVALSGPYDWAAVWPGLPQLTRDAFRVRSHLDSEEAAAAHARALSLAGVAQRIRCPLLVVFGGQDRLLDESGARRLVSEAAGPAELLLIPDGNHVVNNRAHRYRYRSADWMAEQLGGSLQAGD